MEQSSVIICSIVRDCNTNLKKNILRIEKLREFFGKSKVVIFENDSVDGTKETLARWENDSKQILVCTQDTGTKTIPTHELGGVNKYFSKTRISKMAEYRNKYMEVINNEQEYKADYVIIVDLDVAKISIDGIAHSFGVADQWDVITANGYTYFPSLRKRYYDAYALVEMGKQEIPQTEMSIARNRIIWSTFKTGMPLIPVYSAHGGLSIFRYEAIVNRKYRLISNRDKRVEVRCEHYSMCHDIREAGYSRIFVNPNMSLRYLSFSWKSAQKFLNSKINMILAYSKKW